MQKKLDDDGEPWSDEKLMQVDAISFQIQLSFSRFRAPLEF
jgi:hypothetical protein